MATITAPAATSERRALTGAAFAGLFIGSLVLSSVLGDTTFPSPFEPDAEVETYFATSKGAVLGMGILQTLAALPLAAFTATVTRRMARGLRAGLARTGGFLAAATLAATGLISIAIPALEATGDTLHTLHYLAFLTGGLLHVPLLGLLVGAGTVAFASSAPRWTTVLGALSAGLSLLSLISFATEAAMMLLPLGRFTAIIWIVATAVRAASRK